MSELINQAFAHIDGVGPHVRAGHYDIEGPEGELILKNIWETTIQPGWSITMKMWPDLELHALRDGGGPRPGGMAGGGGHTPHGFRIPDGAPPQMRQALFQRYMAERQAHQQRAAGGGHHGHRPVPVPVGDPRMPPMAGRGRPPVPPGAFPMSGGVQGVPGVAVVDGDRRHKSGKSTSKRKKEFVGWLGGKTSGSGSKGR